MLKFEVGKTYLTTRNQDATCELITEGVHKRAIMVWPDGSARVLDLDLDGNYLSSDFVEKPVILEAVKWTYSFINPEKQLYIDIDLYDSADDARDDFSQSYGRGDSRYQFVELIEIRSTFRPNNS